jgi:hypothetical protein
MRAAACRRVLAAGLLAAGCGREPAGQARPRRADASPPVESRGPPDATPALPSSATVTPRRVTAATNALPARADPPPEQAADVQPPDPARYEEAVAAVKAARDEGDLTQALARCRELMNVCREPAQARELSDLMARLREERKAALGLPQAVQNLASPDGRVVAVSREKIREVGEVGRIFLRKALRDEPDRTAEAAATMLIDAEDPEAIELMLRRFEARPGPWLKRALRRGLTSMRGRLSPETQDRLQAVCASVSQRYGLLVSFPGHRGRTPLTNFPVLVVLGPHVRGFDYAQFALPDGGDLRFWDRAGAAPLSFEVRRWDRNGPSFVWVRVPELSGTGTVIRADWGDLTRSAEPRETGRHTWTNAFVGVWHFDEEVTDARSGDTLADSSPARNHAAPFGSSCATGVVAGAQFCDGVGDYIALDSAAGALAAGDFTVCGWLRTTATKGAVLAVNDASGGNRVRLMLGRKEAADLSVLDGETAKSLPAPNPADGRWHHLAYVRRGARSLFYFDGRKIAALPSDSAPAPGDRWSLGQEWDSDAPSDFLAASFDEFQASSVARSDEWLRATWLCVVSNAAFTAYGAVFPAPAAAGTASNAHHDIAR